MKVRYSPHPTDVYVAHYMRGGSSIGEYFRANAPAQYGGGLFSTIGKMAIPLLQKTIIPFVKRTLKRAVPMLKEEGGKVLKSGLKDISDILRKKQNAKQMIKKNKILIRKRVADIIDSQLDQKKRRDIFSV